MSNQKFRGGRETEIGQTAKMIHRSPVKVTCSVSGTGLAVRGLAVPLTEGTLAATVTGLAAGATVGPAAGVVTLCSSMFITLTPPNGFLGAGAGVSSTGSNE